MPKACSDGDGHGTDGEWRVPYRVGHHERAVRMNALWQLLLVILRALMPVLFANAQDTAEDGQAPGALEDRLLRKIKEDGWHG